MKHSYERTNHAKTRLRLHIIFSTKFRRKCLNDIKEDVFKYMSYAADKSGGQFEILIMEIDPAKSDHIHFLIKYVPDCPISKIVHDLKQYSTYHLWKLHASYLKKFFWSKRLLWTRGYFVSTIGEVSEKTIRNYIEKQG